MVALDSIRSLVKEELQAYELFIQNHLSAEGELLSEMLQYALTTRGKGVRPMIVMLSAGLNAQRKGAGLSVRSSLAAMLVEMIHVASLVHDDVIDESDTRRGKPSVNAVWQSKKSVLLGDFILAKSTVLGLQSCQYDLVSMVCGGMASLCEGEILQAEAASKRDMTRDTYLNIIFKKTATLLGISAAAGALSVGAERETVSQMRRFGEALGMAFQIQDDILDYTLDAKTGKPTNNDLREGKITLPLLAVLDRAKSEEREELLERLGQCHTDEASVEWMQTKVTDAGGVEFAESVMQSYINKAVAMLNDYPQSEYRSALINLCMYVAERDR